MKVVFHEEFLSVYISDPAAAPGRMEAVLEAIRPRVDMTGAEPAGELITLGVKSMTA